MQRYYRFTYGIFSSHIIIDHFSKWEDVKLKSWSAAAEIQFRAQ